MENKHKIELDKLVITLDKFENNFIIDPIDCLDNLGVNCKQLPTEDIMSFNKKDSFPLFLLTIFKNLFIHQQDFVSMSFQIKDIEYYFIIDQVFSRFIGQETKVHFVNKETIQLSIEKTNVKPSNRIFYRESVFRLFKEGLRMAINREYNFYLFPASSIDDKHFIYEFVNGEQLLKEVVDNNILNNFKYKHSYIATPESYLFVDNDNNKKINVKNNDIVALGGGKEIGSNSYYLGMNDKKILFDCGFDVSLNDYYALPPIDLLDGVDVAIITHAHTDHIGGIPKLFQYNPGVTFFMTKATHEIYLAQCNDAIKRLSSNDFLSLAFTEDDILNFIDKANVIFLEESGKIQIDDDIILHTKPAGHILGAVQVVLEHNNKKLLYTGDISFDDQETSPSAEFFGEDIDTLIIEGTSKNSYNNRDIQVENFITNITKELEQGKNILLPAFALGRSQEILALLQPLCAKGIINQIKTLGLTNQMNKIYEGYERVKLTSCSESDAFNFFNEHEPYEKTVIIASGGMLNNMTSASRCFQRVKGLSDWVTMFTGYCAPSTPAGQLAYYSHTSTVSDDTTINEAFESNRIQFYHLSGHADRESIINYIHRLSPSNLLLVHGSEDNLNSIKTSYTHGKTTLLVNREHVNVFQDNVIELTNKNIKKVTKNNLFTIDTNSIKQMMPDFNLPHIAEAASQGLFELKLLEDKTIRKSINTEYSLIGNSLYLNFVSLFKNFIFKTLKKEFLSKQSHPKFRRVLDQVVNAKEKHTEKEIILTHKGAQLDGKKISSVKYEYVKFNLPHNYKSDKKLESIINRQIRDLEYPYKYIKFFEAKDRDEKPLYKIKRLTDIIFVSIILSEYMQSEKEFSTNQYNELFKLNKEIVYFLNEFKVLKSKKVQGDETMVINGSFTSKMIIKDINKFKRDLLSLYSSLDKVLHSYKNINKQNEKAS